MDATAWTVVGAVHARIDAQGEDLRRRLDAHGEQMGQLRERMAHLEGLRDAVAGKRVA